MADIVGRLTKTGAITSQITPSGGGGGGTGDYNDLTNKPKINNVTLIGNKTAADLGLVKPSDITASKSGDTTTIYVNGVAIATVKDGTNGQDGEDGYSPSASVSKSGDTATISITDKDGTTTAIVTDGQDGRDGHDGQDGYSPTASVSKAGTTATITITDKSGTTTVQINDGQDGQPGQDGEDGEDGHTPVKGTDYWTAQDQAAIVQDVVTYISPTMQTKAITDTGGYYTTDTVEGALQEIGAELAGVNTIIGTGVIS